MSAKGVDRSLNDDRNILLESFMSVSQQTFGDVKIIAVPKNSNEDAATPHSPAITSRLSVFVFLNFDTRTPITTDGITMYIAINNIWVLMKYSSIISEWTPPMPSVEMGCPNNFPDCHT